MPNANDTATGTFKAKYDPGAEISGGSWLTLHRNENLFVDREMMVEMAKKMIDKAAVTTYPGATCDELRAALAEEYGVQPENIFVGNGSDEVLADLLHLLRRRYDRIGLPDVCFKIYLLLAERFEYEINTIPGDTFTTGKIETSDWNGLAVVDSPNAITSSRIAPDVFHDLAKNEDSFVIWDNAYGEYANDTVPVNMPRNMVLVRTFSKFYALAGLRIGYCIADAALVQELLARKDAFNVNGFAQVMALETLRRKNEFAGIRDQVIACRQELVTRLHSLGFQTHEAGGNFVLAKHPAFSGEFIQTELQKKHVAVRRFPGTLTSDHIRITIPPMPVVEQFAGALAEIIQN